MQRAEFIVKLLKTVLGDNFHQGYSLRLDDLYSQEPKKLGRVELRGGISGCYL